MDKFLFRFKKFNKWICFYIILMIITSCSINTKKEIDSKDIKKPIVLTTFTVLSDIAKNVAGDRLIVRSITKPGSEIHSYEFTPSDIIKAKNADLIIKNGLGLERWIERFLTSIGDVPSISLSDGMNPILIKGDTYAGKPNPHAWMSPKRTIAYVNKLLEAFIEIDPQGKEDYMRNAELYKNKLLALDQELEYFISKIPEEKKLLVTCEGAFSYLANDYGFREAYLWPVNSENQVTPIRMANLIKKIKKNDIPTIFCESTVNSRAQKEVARATGASFGGSFFVDSLSAIDGPAATFLDLQRYNLDLIIKGLEPSIDIKK